MVKLVTISLAKLRQNVDAILNISVSFICADKSYIISSLCSNVLTTVTAQHSTDCNLQFLYTCSDFFSTFILHITYRKRHTYVY